MSGKIKHRIKTVECISHPVSDAEYGEALDQIASHLLDYVCQLAKSNPALSASGCSKQGEKP